MEPKELAEKVASQDLSQDLNTIEAVEAVAKYFVQELGDMDEDQRGKAIDFLKGLLLAKGMVNDFVNEIEDAVDIEINDLLEAENARNTDDEASAPEPEEDENDENEEDEDEIVGIQLEAFTSEETENQKQEDEAQAQADTKKDEPFVQIVIPGEFYLPKPIIKKWVEHRRGLDNLCLEPLSRGDRVPAEEMLLFWKHPSRADHFGQELADLCINYLKAALKEEDPNDPEHPFYHVFHVDKKTSETEPEAPEAAEENDAS